MISIEQGWYRISIKALIFNYKGDLLLCKEKSGVWDLPGGGLDHGEKIETCLKRELEEEMGLKITRIDINPTYFITAHKPESKTRPWISNICYKVETSDLNFVVSDECIEIEFFSIEGIKKINTIINVNELVKQMLLN